MSLMELWVIQAQRWQPCHVSLLRLESCLGKTCAVKARRAKVQLSCACYYREGTCSGD